MTHVLPMYEYIHGFSNALFVLAGPPPATVPNCCFPQFLSYEAERVCRRHFEGMNGKQALVIPAAGGAYGVGTSATDRDGTLCAPLRVSVDGVELTITHL